MLHKSILWVKSSYLKAAEIQGIFCFVPTHDMKEVRCEDKGHTFPAYTKDAFPVTQDVTKINVKEVA